MAKNIAKHVNVNAGTPQSEKAREDQVLNNAGGYVFKTSEMEQLRRFLILGSSGGTYYVGERKLTQDNAKNIVKLFNDAKTGIQAVQEIIRVSDEGIAPKNDPAIFALALAASSSNSMVRNHALKNLDKVCRIGTHLFTFITYVDEMRGWGKGLQKAIQRWYDNKGENLAFQVCKYPQRRVEGCLPWSHRDVLRKIHMKPSSLQMGQVFKYVVKGKDGFNGTEWDTDKALQYIWAHDKAKNATTTKEIVPLIKTYRLARESVPNQLFGKEVFEALQPHMGMTALIRNLNRMTECGLLVPMGKVTNEVIDKLTDETLLAKERVHPFNILVAQRQYMCGQSRNLTWQAVPAIVDALEDAFYKSFQFVEPTGKRFLLGLDVSGSMGSQINSSNKPGNIYSCYSSQPGALSCAEAAAAMSMVTARTEKKSHVMGFADSFRDLGIRANDTLDQVLRKTSSMNFGGTDCSLPMKWALKNNVEVDVFIVYTDNETWYDGGGYSWGGQTHNDEKHVFEALNQYRKKTGIDAKLVSVAMSPTNFSIVDPKDAGMLNVVGFDSSAPQIIHDFAADKI